MEFTGATSESKRYTTSETWTGPIAARICYRQVVVIPVKEGNITLPTSHVVCLGQNQNVYKKAKYIPIHQLGPLKINDVFG